ncbi:MAG: ABC transporter ATP-binding protein [Synergistaceae bacterium]|nr:ABC transporter ATP-binding protein [Synergistaceae bacterium]
MLEVNGLRYKYPDGHEALHGVTFSVKSGEKVALAGANGSGKSTLLLHLAGALEVQEGTITGTKAGLTFQDADDELLMPTVLEDVAFSLVAGGVSLREAHERAMKILVSLGIEHLADRPPHRLSGGEKRMVSFAGVLATGHDVLALDEPSAGLDPRARRRVIDFLRRTDKTILLATHDLDMALDVCSRAVILSGGTVAAEGALPELFRDKETLEACGLELPLRYSKEA